MNWFHMYHRTSNAMCLPTNGKDKYTYESPRRNLNWRLIRRHFQRVRIVSVLLILLFWWYLRHGSPIELPTRRRSQIFDQLLTEELTEEQQKHRAEHLEDELHHVSVPLSPYSGHAAFPEYSRYLKFNDEADFLPQLIHIPFEDAVEDVVLDGWEDEWFADGVYDMDTRGKLPEPKIDFVYTCECTFLLLLCLLTFTRGQRIRRRFQTDDA